MKDKLVGLVAGIGAIFVALVASLCCIGPVLVATLGISSVVLFSMFESIRLYLILVLLLLFAYGFYTIYLKKGACDSDDVCADPAKEKYRKIVFWGTTLIIIALISFPYWGLLIL